MHQITPERRLGEPLVAQLGPHHRGRVLQHLRELPAQDLWLRFGYAVTDEALRLYVRKLHFSRDAVFGIFDELLSFLRSDIWALTRTRRRKRQSLVFPYSRARAVGDSDCVCCSELLYMRAIAVRRT